MEHLLEAIVDIEKQAGQIVARADQLQEEGDDGRDIAAQAQKNAEKQIKDFAEKQRAELEEQCAAIDRQSKAALERMNTAFETQKEQWVDALYKIAISED